MWIEVRLLKSMKEMKRMDRKVHDKNEILITLIVIHILRPLPDKASSYNEKEGQT